MIYSLLLHWFVLRSQRSSGSHGSTETVADIVYSSVLSSISHASLSVRHTSLSTLTSATSNSSHIECSNGLGEPINQLPDRSKRIQLKVNLARCLEDVVSGIYQLQQCLYFAIPFYNLTLILAKLSALFLFIRIFRTSLSLLITYIVMGFVVTSGLWIVISGFLFCIPVSDFWSLYKLDSAKHCLPDGPVWFANAAMQIFTDITILIIPMPPLSKLRLPRRKKLGVMLVFGIGIM